MTPRRKVMCQKKSDPSLEEGENGPTVAKPINLIPPTGGNSFIVFSGKPKLAPLPALSSSEFHRLSLLNIPANSRTCCPSSNPYLWISLVSSHTSLVLTFAKMERIWRWSLSSHPLTAIWLKEKRRLNPLTYLNKASLSVLIPSNRPLHNRKYVLDDLFMLHQRTVKMEAATMLLLRIRMTLTSSSSVCLIFWWGIVVFKSSS
ncbi:hypothetical protein NE237_028949 [Protea cynaroides]|uniref:Uncharacterized protein n=1 Tax=Protea cynaroides TaxID=273540 RepID=A0A9Q0GQB8_9MAGN|nr:hypothetical protein NE237_028949 [Protea cynaroides]